VRKAFLNAAYFLKTGGKYLVYVQGNCNEPSHQGGDGVFSSLLKGERVQFQRRELVTLERFHRDDHAYVSGVFRSLEVAEIDQSCLVSNKFWTSKDSDRDPGRRITLYEKQKDLPVYMLLESSWGYILFRAVDVYKVERNYMDTEHYIEDFNKFFEFVASHTFASPDEALRYLTADSHDIVPDGLIDFLVRHLPKTMKDGNGNHCYTLALPNPFIAYEIVNAGFACSASPFHVDIMRGVRRNIEKVFEKMKPGDLEKSQACLARIYGKKLDSPNKGKLPKKKAAPLPSFPTRKKPKKKGPEKYMKENPDDTKSLSI
ncbi:nucleolar protein 56-like, partial [Trifolium pratense]